MLTPPTGTSLDTAIPFSQRGKGVDWAWTFAFLLFLILPGVDVLLNLDPYDPPVENRVPAARPNLPWSLGELEVFPAAWESYFNDRLGFRNTLIRWRSALKYAALGDTPNRKKIIVGKDGFFFDGHFLDIAFYRGWSLEESANQVRTLHDRQIWLDEQGIRYLVALIPAGFTVYWDRMPDHLVEHARDARMEYAVNAFRDETEVEVLDLRFVLNREKKRHRIYQELDTHWNDIGAYAAYREIAARLGRWFPSITIPNDSAFAFGRETRKGLYFNDALALPWDLYEEYPTVIPAEP